MPDVASPSPVPQLVGAPLVLVVVDGLGFAKPGPGNAVAQAATPNLDMLLERFPSTTLEASGDAVGLPHGQRGNSEAGHMNLGAGRVVPQDSLYITQAIADGSFDRNPAFLEAIHHTQRHGGRVHVIGMLTGLQSPHADPDHMAALLKLLAEQQVKPVYLHLFTDGRDTPRFAAIGLLKLLRERFVNGEHIATIMGRFYGMDRKKKWDRTEAAYETIVGGRGRQASTAEEAIMQGYNRGESDEYLSPTVMLHESQPFGQVRDGDSIIFFNLRSDRARQLTKALIQPDFNERNPGSFVRSTVLKDVRCVAMTDFGPDLGDVLTAFPSRDVPNTLPFVLGPQVRQLYVAEAEKFAHITYFFNGGYAQPVAGERRVLVPSPDVVSYDQTPEMGAPGITKVVERAIEGHEANFIALNYSNPDMVGHTGNLLATIKAVQVVDESIGQLWRALEKVGGTLVVTADHGNAERKINTDTGEVYTEHTEAPVPLIVAPASPDAAVRQLRSGGVLGDVAPTLLELLGLPQPAEMTGHSLLGRRGRRRSFRLR